MTNAKKTKEQQEENNAEDIYMFNMRMKDIREVIRLVVAESINIDAEDYDMKKIMIHGYKGEPNPYNDFCDKKYIQINVPLETPKDANYSPRFEIKIFEDGFVSYENGNGCMLKYPNFFEVARIVNERINTQKDTNE